jgi:DNA-binding response OmpR family regulator
MLDCADLPRDVLIVEDDDDVRSLVERVLGRVGLATRAVDCGLSALAAAAKEHPRLVVLDVEMPDLNGLEVCRQLKASEATADMSVLIVSGNTSVAEIAAGYAAGCDDFLTKPFSPAELVRRVTRLLPLSA